MGKGPVHGTDPLPAAERILAHRDHGRGELRRKLLQRGYPAQAVEEALDKLQRLGLLDDARYADQLTRFELSRGHGLSYIRAKLRRRMVALDSPPGTLREEIASLRAFMARKALDPALLTPGPERAKMLRFLRGRGYTSAALAAILHPGDPADPAPAADSGGRSLGMETEDYP